MKKTRMALLFGGVLLSLSAGSVWAEAPTSEPIQAVKPLMRENLNAVVELQKYVSNPNEFSKPENYENIKKLLDQLSGSAHVIPQAIGQDRPGLAGIAVVFSEYLDGLRGHLKNGNPEYLRNRIRTATGFCFECHTNLSTSKSFKDVAKKVESSKMSPFQKIEFYAATRQFDKALEGYQKILSAKAEGDEALKDKSLALRHSMSISVRVKQDPELTEKFLETASRVEDLPDNVKMQVKQWMKDVQDWKKEEKISDESSAAAWLAQGESLLRRARLMQSFPADHVAEVTYLRSVNSLQESLARHPSSAQKAAAYYGLGNAYSALEDPLLFSLNQYYYQACVREVPHTALAKKCVNRVSQEVYFNYSGSSGVDIPAEEKLKLQELKKLAQ